MIEIGFFISRKALGIGKLLTALCCGDRQIKTTTL